MQTKEQDTILLNEQGPTERLPAARPARAPRKVDATPAPAPRTAMDLLAAAADRGASVEELGKFMDLLERQRQSEASQAYMRAITAFKRNVQTIYRDERAAFQAKNKDTGNYSSVEYDFATLGHICEKIIVQMAEHGLSHRWVIEQPPSQIRVTCVLSHEQGHSETASIQYGADNSGSKNPLQAVNSSVTYGERTSLLAVCGIAVKSQGDDDGAKAELQQMAADMRKPVVKQKMGNAGLARAKEAIAAGTYTLAEIEATHELTAEQRAELAGAK